ncbi:MAG TPA: alanine racemase [Rickettsiales bacterium]|nr:alanine racemase [Rickettsiales bacterium]
MGEGLNIKFDYESLVYNFELLRNITGYVENTIPVVKANAYGVGANNIVKTLLNLKEPQKKYCVYSVDEGIELRKNFPQLEIFVLGGILKGEEEYFKKYKLIPVVNSFNQLKLCQNNDIKDLALQFNTGLNRNGIQLKEISKVRKFIDENKIKVLMIVSHFACADDLGSPINQEQIINFEKIVKYFPEKNILRSISASDGVVNFELGELCNTCRVGLGLYGYYKGFKPIYSIYSIVKYEGKNLYMPIGINNGLMSEYKKGYVFINNQKIKIKEILNGKTILESDDKNIENASIEILGENISMKEFGEMSGTDIRDIVARLISNVQEKQKNSENIYRINATIKNNEFISFYSTIIEKRIVEKDGIVGYGATENVKKGDKLATFAGGYLDGLPRCISGKKCFVYIKKIDGKYAKCEIFGKISMDQTIVKVDENDYRNIKIGAKVIIFDKEHSIKQFEKATGKSRNELFFYLSKSSRVKCLCF